MERREQYRKVVYTQKIYKRVQWGDGDKGSDGETSSSKKEELKKENKTRIKL